MIGLISDNDYANFQYGLQESLKSVGVEVKSYKLKPHQFNYPKQVEVKPFEEIKRELMYCRTVINVHSFPYIINPCTIPFHTGTYFRQGYESLNNTFRHSDISLIALPEFQFTAPRFKYCVGAVDTDSLTPDYNVHNPILFGHYPSNKNVKGSLDIINLISQLDVNLRFSFDTVDYLDHIERIKGIDVYIEMLAETQGGKPYGSFGMTTLEAAALGKIVITQSLNDNGIYTDNYSIPMVNFIKNSYDLTKIVNSLSNYSGDHIKGQQEITRQWVVNNHSYKATGERLKKLLEL